MRFKVCIYLAASIFEKAATMKLRIYQNIILKTYLTLKIIILIVIFGAISESMWRLSVATVPSKFTLS